MLKYNLNQRCTLLGESDLHVCIVAVTKILKVGSCPNDYNSGQFVLFGYVPVVFE